MLSPQFGLPLHTELVVDNFAGGGGASSGIERALGRPVDIAINHDPEAVAMHTANHPQTRHFCENVWDVKPAEVTAGQPVGLAWFSPDCKHHSKAKGGKPVEKRIRGLAWVALRWVATTRPRIVMLENVEEFVSWGPLTPEGRPCPRRKGREFGAFCNALRSHGYQVEHRELRACDYGAPTSRKRLFLIARRDGQPIVWPTPTHGKPGSAEVKAGQRKPWRTAAECIDWSTPCPSIFERSKPLAEATLRRVARGIERYVVNTAKPFIVRIGQTGHGGAGKPALVSAFLAKHYGGVVGQAVAQTLGTVTSVDHHSLVTAHMVGIDNQSSTGAIWPADSPLRTTTVENRHALVTSNLVKLRGTSTAAPVDAPAPTITGQGTHLAEVRAFLIKFYSSGSQHSQLSDPMHTLPTHDRMGLVTVAGVDYAIVDIGLRMLQPRELAAAQGFPGNYILAPMVRGKPLTKTAQVRMIGNSVCPDLAEALVRANYREQAVGAERRAA